MRNCLRTETCARDLTEAQEHGPVADAKISRLVYLALPRLVGNHGVDRLFLSAHASLVLRPMDRLGIESFDARHGFHSQPR